jgi:hypothetical protein
LPNVFSKTSSVLILGSELANQALAEKSIDVLDKKGSPARKRMIAMVRHLNL